MYVFCVIVERYFHAQKKYVYVAKPRAYGYGVPVLNELSNFVVNHPIGVMHSFLFFSAPFWIISLRLKNHVNARKHINGSDAIGEHIEKPGTRLLKKKKKISNWLHVGKF